LWAWLDWDCLSEVRFLKEKKQMISGSTVNQGIKLLSKLPQIIINLDSSHSKKQIFRVD